jgi:hypothetical protein
VNPCFFKLLLMHCRRQHTKDKKDYQIRGRISKKPVCQDFSIFCKISNKTIKISFLNKFKNMFILNDFSFLNEFNQGSQVIKGIDF